MNREIRTRLAGRQLDAVAYEVAQEKAASLRRIGLRLERALEALRAYDDAPDRVARPEGHTERAALVTAAAEALWYFVVQREACGLRDPETVFRELRVPRDVQLRMGVREK